MADIEYHGPYAYDRRTCPRCESADVKYGWIESTLLGWHPDRKNPNHHKQEGKCTACSLKFVREWKESADSTWCVQEGEEYEGPFGKMNYRHLIAGIAVCCESTLLFPCACGAWMTNQQRGKVVRGSVGPDGKWTVDPPNLWDCEACGRNGLTLGQWKETVHDAMRQT